MPRTTVYIRNEDWEKWKVVSNKSQLISEALNKSVIHAVERRGKVMTEQHIEPLPGQTSLAPKVVPMVPKGVCKTHGFPLVSGNKCLQKGCKG